MINKKILLLAGAAIAAMSIAIAITVNVVVNKSASTDGAPDHLTCSQLQRAIDNLDKPALSQLPEIIRNDIEWIRVRDFDCRLKGKNWTLLSGKLIQPKSVHRPVLGDESNILDDFK